MNVNDTTVPVRRELTSIGVPVEAHGTLDAKDCVDSPLRRPFREVPRDFVRRWPEVGWDEAKEVWHAHSRTIARWVDECGRDEMVLARKRWLDERRALAARARAKRYVLGRTRTPAR